MTEQGYDDNREDVLTEEEMELIKSYNESQSTDSSDDEEANAVKELADSGDDDGDDDGGGGDSAPPIEGKQADGGQDETVNDQDGNGDSQSDSETDDSDAGNQDQDGKQFVYKSELPEGYDEQVKALADEKAEIRRQFREGDIDFDEYDAKQAELADKQLALEKSAIKAEISQEIEQQSAASQWEAAVNRNLNSFKDQIDYRSDDGKLADLDNFVKALAAKPENNDKSMDWFMSEAHKRVLALHDIAAPSGSPKDKPNRKSPLDKAPQTLANVAGSDGPDDLQQEFQEVARLDGDDFENAIASLTPAQRERLSRMH